MTQNRFIGGTAAAKSLQLCLTLCDPIDSSPPGSRPWDSPGKSTGVGCHFLLQCMKAKSESEVAQSCPTLSNPMDCSLPGSSIHGIFQARVLEWGAIAFSAERVQEVSKAGGEGQRRQRDPQFNQLQIILLDLNIYFPCSAVQKQRAGSNHPSQQKTGPLITQPPGQMLGEPCVTTFPNNTLFCGICPSPPAPAPGRSDWSGALYSVPCFTVLFLLGHS